MITRGREAPEGGADPQFITLNTFARNKLGYRHFNHIIWLILFKGTNLKQDELV